MIVEASVMCVCRAPCVGVGPAQQWDFQTQTPRHTHTPDTHTNSDPCVPQGILLILGPSWLRPICGLTPDVPASTISL